jgi:large subunit ribosomal protein L24
MKPLVYKRTRKAARTKPVPQAMKMHVTKGDTVQVISGDDKGKRGTVLRTYPKRGRVVVQGVNIIKKHQRASQTSEAGIIEREAPIYVSKVMLIDPKTNEPTRIRRRRDADGTVERIAAKSGQAIVRSR